MTEKEIGQTKIFLHCNYMLSVEWTHSGAGRKTCSNIIFSLFYTFVHHVPFILFQES